MKCPGFERLVDYLDGQSSVEEANTVAAHLAAGCRECADNRAWYEQVRAITSTDDSVEPPQWVLKRAFRIFETRQAGPRLKERIGQALARLIFDSSERPALAGVRSTGVASRQLLYRADDYSIDLQIAPAEHSHASLIGQVLKEGEAAFESVTGLQVRLARDGETISSAITDSLGEFTIRTVACGEYNLIIELGEQQITIEKLPVEHS